MNCLNINKWCSALLVVSFFVLNTSCKQNREVSVLEVDEVSIVEIKNEIERVEQCIGG
ncbi:hypothetical protein [Algibacter lectus]|uniref:Uncharacterized protein n=1 Tax=Algibacter lectus TaxID=221126 RepID=A0A090X0A9_9FLAO|nr:hypothetical protein JCM19300_2964 [Algibacter lectus]GAL81134.1 hypothetical protein JCM19274_3878 [Algibacter lectus]